ncbi:MAG TPA: hypothetical protein VK281_17380, partial [Xanthobacteraceae bacterium]|nr:hypothetical protein [Xanthobacteraceae bacterium]
MKDRRTEVIGSLRYNGIDFVEIADPSQTVLRVHFLNAVELGTLASPPGISGGETIPTVAVKPFGPSAWGFDQGHLVLRLEVVAPGDFSNYTLAISSPRLDRYFDHVQFSFKALCPSDLDCEQAAAPCPPLPSEAPPIDYLAKDFLSFRQALLDFSALRYPQWQERSEADFGVMFAEALSAIADDLSYTQDRYAAEAALVTATQRRSVIRHAELVDYTPGPMLSSGVMLQFDVRPGVQQIPAGIVVIARAPDGTPTYFETGPSLSLRLIDPVTGAPRTAPPQVSVSALWNSGLIEAYWFDDGKRCLEAGATQMHVRGRGYGFMAGQLLLIETPGATTADPALLQIVTLTAVEEECDPIFTRVPDGSGPPFMTCPTSPPSTHEPTAVTHLVWGTSDALSAARDLTRTHVVGNIVPATQGLTVANEAFVVTAPAPGDPATPTTIVRTGPRPTQPDGTPGTAIPLQFHSLAQGPVAWLPSTFAGTDSGGTDAQPEILLRQRGAVGPAAPWRWTPQLVTAGQFDNAYTLDAARFAMIARNSDLSPQYEYAGDTGDTIRFGGNNFGILPDDGTSFTVTYRVGVGAAGNVAAGAINQVAPGSQAGILAVTNPLPASGGADPETLSSVQLLAPQAFRARQFRAVLPFDYEAAAETLPWVQRAGTSFRWTGSWLSVFTAADPLHGEQITTAQRTGLIELLNRYRMAGYESYVPDPDYVSLDLAVSVCAAPTAFGGEVESGVLAALDPGGVS